MVQEFFRGNDRFPFDFDIKRKLMKTQVGEKVVKLIYVMFAQIIKTSIYIAHRNNVHMVK